MSGYLDRMKANKRQWKRLWFVIKDKVLYTYAASEVGEKHPRGFQMCVCDCQEYNFVGFQCFYSADFQRSNVQTAMVERI